MYARFIFPPILDRAMRSRKFDTLRPTTIGEASGKVLEIGFGTGLNLPHYSQSVKQLVALDCTQMLKRRVARRIAASPLSLTSVVGDACDLPFEPNSFDCVVSTFTLCSIDQVNQALHEVKRVLKPTGRFLFLEHGRSDDAKVARKQDRWNWLQRRLACGCNLNRQIDQLVEQADLKVECLERSTPFRFPRILAEIYQGVAVKAE